MPDPRLFIDIQTVQSLRFGERGIPRYATELSRALLDQRAHAVAALALNPLLPWPERIHPDLARAPQLTWNTATAFRRALGDGSLIYLVVSPFELCRPVQGMLAPHVVGVPHVAVVHDLIPELFGLYDPESSFGRMYEQRRRSVRTADLLLTPSESTRRDVVAHWDMDPARVSVVGEAASPFFCPPGPGEDPRARLRADVPAITRPFVLCVSGWDAHKNTEALIEAWARLGRAVRGSHQLVVACSLPDEGRRAWSELAERRGLRSGELVLTGFVDDTVLRALYRAASLFVLPSRSEGFGLPVLEAIGCGCPAITSSASALPEILEWPPATFAPDEPDQIAALVERALSDSSYREELRGVGDRAADQHNWSLVIERLMKSCAPLARSRTRRRRPRLALVGPFPPASSWIAAYNARLVDHLAPHCDLDCFAEPVDGLPITGTHTPRREYRILPAGSLGSTFNPASYDVVLYALGSDHGETGRLALTYPGVVWLHELRLARAELVSSARGLIVASGEEQLLLSRELASTADDLPTWSLPLALPPGAEPSDRAKSWSFDDVARGVLDIARADLEPLRPREAMPVSGSSP